MKLLAIVTLMIAGAALAACGTTRDNRFNETAYADHNGPERTYYDHDVMYRSPAYGERYVYGEDVDVVYVRPAYRVVPVARDPLIYDGYYYYRD
ncbi:MAG TPA: hypothetical protein VGQ35_18215 [Dongiaceae bacterium]|jgi:hypothetical protein|nr:hypothetical protein [Dongiaceae bacterium]